MTPEISVLTQKLFYYNNKYSRKALNISGQNVVSRNDNMGTQKIPIKISVGNIGGVLLVLKGYLT